MDTNSQNNIKVTFNWLSFVRDFIVSSGIALLILLSSVIKIPFYPIPFTLQTFAIPLICLSLRSRRQIFAGLAMFVAYRIIQNSATLLMTFGYIVGFFLMTYILTMKEINENFKTVVTKLIFSQFIVLLAGTCILSFSIGIGKAFQYGFLFFIPSAIIKLIAIISIYSFVGQITKNKVER